MTELKDQIDPIFAQLNDENLIGAEVSLSCGHTEDGVSLTSMAHPTVPHPSGMRHPVEYKVLIRPDDVMQRSKGGIIIPPTVQAMEKNAMCKGVIEMVSYTAFTYFDRELLSYDEVCERYPDTPRIGDHVLFGKYAGATWRGDDGVDYRIVNDKDIISVIV